MKLSAAILGGLGLVVLTGCGGGPQLQTVSTIPITSGGEQSSGAKSLASTPASTAQVDSLATSVPATVYTIHVVDVGTGLGIFVEGPGFSLVYDAGSNDDIVTGTGNRFLAYLQAASPILKTIDHVILSHPHTDHVDLLADVVTNYRVTNVWDSGAKTGICGYEKFVRAVKDTGATYHSAANNPGGKIVFDKACAGLPSGFKVNQGSPIVKGMAVPLGPNATMTFLYADGKTEPDPNDNSLVVRLDLGGKRVLLMGDAGGGGRDNPSKPPKPGSIEAQVLALGAGAIDSDVLIVGHHGSKTSSRKAFLDAVTPAISVISSGPKQYDKVTLPDAIIVGTLSKYGQVFRTDRDDVACAKNPAKIGLDNDGNPGGCDNVRITIAADGALKTEYWTQAD